MVDDEAMSCRADAMTKPQDADVLDARDVVRKDPLTLLRAIYVALDMLDDELGNDTDMSAAVGDVIAAKKHVMEAIDTLEHLYDDDARKPSELGDAPTSPPSDVAVGSVPAGGSDGRRAKLRAMLKSLLFAMDRHLLGTIGDFEAVALFEEDDEYKAWAKRLANELRRFREWIAIRTATLDVEGDAHD